MSWPRSVHAVILSFMYIMSHRNYFVLDCNWRLLNDFGDFVPVGTQMNILQFTYLQLHDIITPSHCTS